MEKKDTFIDLFSGIGGFRIAFTNANFKCTFSSEINEHCKKVYSNNFNEFPFGDINLIDPTEIPDFDVLTAGFPCQPFSISGLKKGFEDTRGTLFFTICKIIKEKKPKVVVLENVKHLIHHNKGKTLEVILDSLEELGYNVSYKLLNARDFGVPQNRERIIIIATKYGKFDFNKINYIYSKPLLRDFLDTENNDIKYLDKSEYTLVSNIRLQDSGLLFVGYRNKGIWKKGIRENTEHLSRVHRQPNRIYSIDGIHPTIPSQETAGRFFIYDTRIDEVRKMSLSECYRIMGFPNNFRKSDIVGEAYKQIGNSVCIPLMQEIAQQIKLQGLINGTANNTQRQITRTIQRSLFDELRCG